MMAFSAGTAYKADIYRNMPLTIPPKMKFFFEETGYIARFTGKFFTEGFKPRYEFQEFLRQCFLIGNKSLSLVGLTAFILGLVLTIQLRPPLLRYGVEFELPYIVADSVIREIGPVITALIFAGKIGSGIGAELGSMKVTEQIDAMEVSGTNPFKYLVVTRVLATSLMLPLLVIMSCSISLLGAYIGYNIKGQISFELFFGQIFQWLPFSAIIPSLIKTLFFGFAVGMVGCYRGYHSTKGTEGVGRAANATVVISSFLIFLIDLVAVQITDLLGFTS
jgi:phospholipid/cholesterol/gamma-HCH transport system permease protein